MGDGDGAPVSNVNHLRKKHAAVERGNNGERAGGA